MSMTERTELLLGRAGIDKLKNSRVLLFGVGGVGSYAAEALARAGVGHLTLVDADDVSDSNRNRQLIALCSTVGHPKAQVAAERIHDINPDCRVTALKLFFMPETSDQIDFSGFDYVIDAVDTVTAKLEILRCAQAAGVPVISCMGTGNKLHPEKLCLTTLDKTSGCPLAKIMRAECRKRGIAPVRVVYSTELPARVTVPDTEQTGRHAPGSVSFVPGAAGLMLAGAVVRALTGMEATN